MMKTLITRGVWRPDCLMTEKLDLLTPIYRMTACHGHFGREDPDLTWERIDRPTALTSALS